MSIIASHSGQVGIAYPQSLGVINNKKSIHFCERCPEGQYA
jgi:hypothetical protein